MKLTPLGAMPPGMTTTAATLERRMAGGAENPRKTYHLPPVYAVPSHLPLLCAHGSTLANSISPESRSMQCSQLKNPPTIEPVQLKFVVFRLNSPLTSVGPIYITMPDILLRMNRKRKTNP